MSDETYHIKTEVEVLKRDINRLGDLFDKLDVAIDKLSEVANGINKMLAVQENRLTQQEDISRHIFTIIENRQKEINEKYEHLNIKIQKTEEEVKSEINKTVNCIMTKIDKIATDVNSIEKWRYIVLGGAIVIGFLLSNVPLIGNLFHR